MIKKVIVITMITALIGLLILGAVNRTMARSEDQNTERQNRGHSDSMGAPIRESWENSNSQGRGGQGGRRGNPGGTNALPAGDPGDLSAEEIEGLLYMREEEKLAHDVYVTLFDKWGVATFQNIAASEQAHTDAVNALIERYGLQDPAMNDIGVFSNPQLQELYDQLVARGSQSLSEALKIGAAIEEIDILDLKGRIDQTDQLDILQVYNNLLRGSSNHLRAFTSALKSQAGLDYQPQYLSDDEYQSIINGAPGRGQGNGGSGGGYRGGRP